MGILQKIKAADLPQQNETSKIMISIGTVFSKLKGKLDRIVINKIDEELSCWQEGAQFTRPYRKGFWDGYIRFLKKREQIFPTGFIGNVCRILDKENILYTVSDTRKHLKISSASIEKAILSKKNIKPRQYQIKAVIKALESECGIINIPTGTGKTLIINLIIKAIDIEAKKKVKHLIITSGLSLLTQLREEISKFQDEDIGFIGESIWDKKRITVASIDSLFRVVGDKSSLKKKSKKSMKTYMAKKSNLKKKKIVKSLLTEVTTLFLDEAHHSPAKTFRDVIYKTTAPIRIGTTATYIRSGSNDMLLHAVTGKITYKKSISWMIDKGYLAKPTIILMEYEGEDRSTSEIDKEYSKILEEKYGKIRAYKKYKKAKSWNKIYTVQVSHNNERNLLLATVLNEFYKFSLNSVLFVTEKYQGEFIYNKCISEFNIIDHKMSFLSGSDSVEEVRKPVLKQFQKGKIRTIICTRILNEGIDFPEANVGIRAGAQMFEGNIIQQLGRILRKVKKPLARDINRNELQRVFWFDLLDFHNKHLANHSLERIKTYESESAFDVRFIKSINGLKKILNEQIKDVKIIRMK